MYDHVGLKVKDVAASVKFYSAVLAPLGFVLCTQDDSGAGFGPPGAPALWIAKGESKGAGVHVAFAAKTHDAVQKFHRAGVEAGGRDHGKPGPRPDYGAKYYAAFLIDPDGNNVEAVCME